MSLDFNINELKNEKFSLSAFITQLEQEFVNCFPGSVGVVVGLSGGLDSSTLLRLFCLSNLKPKVRALHINYQLRGEESDGDAQFCQDLCKGLGIPLDVVTNYSAAPTNGVQNWARNLRREEFQKWQARGFIIATAHQADDLAETVLFRLARGASIGHLLGMMRVGDKVWRPLLEVDRATISQLAKQKSWDHREDSSNAKIKYSRNFIRHELIPRLNQLFPGVDQRLRALAAEGKDLEQYCLDSLRNQLGEQITHLPARTLGNFSEGVAFQVLRLMLEAIGEESLTKLVSRSLWHQLYKRVKTSQEQQISWCFDLPGGLLFKFDHGFVSVVREKQRQKRNRAAQHSRGLSKEVQEALLGPGAQLKVFFDHDQIDGTTLENSGSLTKLLTASIQDKGSLQTR